MDAFTFSCLSSSYPGVSSLLSLSIGRPTFKKIQQILQSYTAPLSFLRGCFYNYSLVGIIGFDLEKDKIIIRHLAVLPAWQRQGIGQSLIHYISSEWKIKTLEAETDSQAVEFYRKCGFSCQHFIKDDYQRYQCIRYG